MWYAFWLVSLLLVCLAIVFFAVQRERKESAPDKRKKVFSAEEEIDGASPKSFTSEEKKTKAPLAYLSDYQKSTSEKSVPVKRKQAKKPTVGTKTKPEEKA